MIAKLAEFQGVGATGTPAWASLGAIHPAAVSYTHLRAHETLS
jgi:hypothetical protein